MKIACVQMKAHDLREAEAGLQHALALIDEAAQGSPDLILLPECTYPAYFLRGLDEYRAAAPRAWADVTALFARKARAYGCHIIVGLVRASDTRSCLTNAAVLFGPEGTILGETGKAFLWHFDQRWFCPATDYPVFDTVLGSIGMIVCADGRMPEIARVLALRGARLIADPTALVTGGGDWAALTNPQIEYMLATRAAENGVWLAAANKVGLEAESVLYCGRSCVISPAGEMVAVASPDREEILFADVDLGDSQRMPVDRVPEAYAPIAAPTESLPVTAVLRESVVPDEAVVRIAAAQVGTRNSVEAFTNRVRDLLQTATRQGVRLLALPGIDPLGEQSTPDASASLLSGLQSLSSEFPCGIAVVATEHDGSKRYRTCFLWHKGSLVGKYRKVHQPAPGYVSGQELPVFATPFGRVGVMLDEEGLVPEAPRVLMLRGADILLWPSASSRLPLRQWARARADENKVYVVLAAPLGEGTAIVSPSGALLAAALPDVEQIIGAQAAWSAARYKEMAPGTHVVWGRQPDTYDELVRRR